jgi:hypothetical protein
MNKTNKISEIIKHINDQYRDSIHDTGNHYLEVNIGREAERMGLTGLPAPIQAADVVVPLREPVEGMKVMIDGRTFVDYARFESGLAAPGYVARAAGLPFTAYAAPESMVLNFA